MIIAISIMVFMNIVSLIYIGIVIFEIRDKTNNVYPELMKIIKDQQNVLQGTLDSMNRWSDLCVDIISHIERVEDMEGDIKDIFEWIHSVDDNVADMRKDIQLIQDPLTNALLMSTNKIEKDILEIKKKLSPEKYNWDDWNKTMVNTAEGNDTDGDLSSNDKDVYALYEEIVDRSMKKYESILKGDNKDDNNRAE